MPFPLEPEFVKDFAGGLETVLVVEEKRSFLELQLREILYDLPGHPAVLGKSHFATTGELDPDKMARVLCEVLSLPARQVAVPGVVMSAPKSIGRRLSVPVARIIVPRYCWMARSRAAASGATPWRCG
jgi:indolepyruvate ferredoxin oxidoreductase